MPDHLDHLDRLIDQYQPQTTEPHNEEKAALPPMPSDTGHELIVMAERQRKRGWYLAWRCMRQDCNTGGNMTISARAKAWELFEILAVGHRESPDAPLPAVRHASPGCACGVNDAGQRYVDPICRRQ